MKKRLASIIAVFSLIGMSFAGMVFSTLSWFEAYLAVPDNKINGQVEGAYFAYGDGLTPETAYGITNYRHFYNLSWLTYLGRFKDRQYYFELGNDVDMGGTVIPPIGTTQYPFIGHFDGQNYVVSNFTISNFFGDYVIHPTNETSIDSNVVKVVGVFGVVGDYPNNQNTAVYSSQINKLENAGFSNFTVKTVAIDTLIGLVAGYSSADIVNVAADQGTINITANNPTYFNNAYTERISDYGIIGYTTKKQQISQYSNTTYGVTIDTEDQFPVEDQGSSASWGGSINMKKMYTELLDKFEHATAAGYVTSRTASYDDVGRRQSLSESTNNSTVFFPYAEYENRFSTSENSYHVYANNQVRDNEENKITASYGFVKDCSSSSRISDAGTFIKITGDREVKCNGNNTTSVTSNRVTGHLIRYANTNNFLSFSSNTLGNCTAEKDAVVWNYSASAHTLSARGLDNSGALRYLTCDANGNLGLSQNTSAVWYATSTIYYAVVNNKNFALCFDGTNWVTNEVETYTTIKSGNNYLNTSLGSQTNFDDSVKWYEVGDYYSATKNGNSYLGATSSWWSYSLSANATTYAFTRNGNYLSFTVSDWFSDTTYYLRYNDGWSCSTSSTSLTIDSVVANVSGSLDPTQVKYESGETHRYLDGYTVTTSVPRFVHSYPTFVPLKSINDDNYQDANPNAGIPDLKNTGYLVGGANYTGDPNGDIRFSAFPDQHGNGSGTNVASLRNSYTKGKNYFDKVFTIDGNGRHDILDTNWISADTRKTKYPKYEKAASKLVGNLSTGYTGTGSGSIHGLHFMDAQITYGGEKSAIIEKAVINGTTYTNYEVPTTCIDFNLKDKGRITFFAGTYFWGNTAGNVKNDSFFSLHTVERYTKAEEEGAGPRTGIKENAIKSIKEIQSIYKSKSDDAAPYVYAYNTNPVTYSINDFVSNNYDLVFNTDWIKKQATASSAATGSQLIVYDAAYYYEIPVNEGEYALGSVDGGIGGYLMYLDIGANAALLNRAIFGEKWQTIQKDYMIPLGVAFVAAANMSALIAQAGVNPSKSEFFAIYAGNGGNIKLTQTSTTRADFSTTAAGLTYKVGYADETITVYNPSGTAMESTPLLKTTTTVEQTLYADYNSAMAETTKTAIVNTTTQTVTDFGAITNNGPITTYWQVLPGGDEDHPITNPSNIVFYESENGTKVAITSVATQAASESTLIQFKFTTTNGVTATITLKLHIEVNSTTHYYEIAGYDIYVEDGSGNPIEVTGIGVTITTVDGVQTVTVTVDGQEYEINFNPPKPQQQEEEQGA